MSLLEQQRRTPCSFNCLPKMLKWLLLALFLVSSGSSQSCNIVGDFRIDCGYGGITEVGLCLQPCIRLRPCLQDSCLERGCCYGELSGYPSCFYPGNRVNITTVHIVSLQSKTQWTRNLFPP